MRPLVVPLLVTLLAGLAACGNSPPSASPAPASAASTSPAATIATAAPTASNTEASPSAAPWSPVVPAGWVREHPELTRLFEGVLVCRRTEGFLLDSMEHRTIRSYEISAPSAAQEDLDKGFREAARGLGYAVSDSVNGRGFQDKSKGISASISDATLQVLFTISDPVDKAAAPLSSSLGFETWGLLTGLADATWKDLHVDQTATSTSLRVEIDLGVAGRASVEPWAESHHLVRSDGDWVQKWQPAPSPRAGIDIALEAGKTLRVVEIRGEDSSKGPCQDHPTRKAKTAPVPSGPTPSDDELMKQMMGK